MLDREKIEKFISTPRLKSYVEALDKKDINVVYQAYDCSIRLSESFYPLLSILEVSLRNSVDTFFRYRYGDQWTESECEQNGFMSNPKLRYLRKAKRGQTKRDNGSLYRYVKHNTSKVKSEKQKVTHDCVLAELPFVCWTMLFNKKHFSILNKPLYPMTDIFPEMEDRDRKSAISNSGKIIHDKLKRIRMFRNRVYHNEPICFTNKNVLKIKELNTDYSLSIRENIYEILAWLNQDLTDWAKTLDRTEVIMKEIDSYR